MDSREVAREVSLVGTGTMGGSRQGEGYERQNGRQEGIGVCDAQGGYGGTGRGMEGYGWVWREPQGRRYRYGGRGVKERA